MSYEVVAKSKLAVEVEGTEVHFRIRSEDRGELLADTRLSADQAIYYAQLLLGAAFEARDAARKDQSDAH